MKPALPEAPQPPCGPPPALWVSCMSRWEAACPWQDQSYWSVWDDSGLDSAVTRTINIHGAHSFRRHLLEATCVCASMHVLDSRLGKEPCTSSNAQHLEPMAPETVGHLRASGAIWKLWVCTVAPQGTAFSMLGGPDPCCHLRAAEAFPVCIQQPRTCPGGTVFGMQPEAG